MVHEDGSEEKIMSYEYDNIVLGPPVRLLRSRYALAAASQLTPGPAAVCC